MCPDAIDGVFTGGEVRGKANTVYRMFGRRMEKCRKYTAGRRRGSVERKTEWERERDRPAALSDLVRQGKVSQHKSTETRLFILYSCCELTFPSYSSI